MKFSELKKTAFKRLSRHYFMFTLTCLFAAFLLTDYSSSLLFARLSGRTSVVSLVETGSQSPLLGIDDLIEDISEHDDNIFDFIAKKIHPSPPEDTRIGDLEIAYRDGVMAQVISDLYSGTYVIQIAATINRIIKDPQPQAILTFIVFALILLAIWIFISNVFKAIMKRIFIEGDTYDRVPFHRYAFLVQSGRWLRASAALAYSSLCHTLWYLTVIGGFIKSYSYFAVPYIIAENPTVKGREAVLLSRQMMDGHKLEAFKLDLTFLGWGVLSVLTAGITGLFFSNPYKEATLAAYYRKIREGYLEKCPEAADVLSNTYLFEHAPLELISGTYADMEVLKENLPPEPERRAGIRGFLENNLGLIFRYDKREKEYMEYTAASGRVEIYEDILAGKTYPMRLNSIKNRFPERQGRFSYLRHYSVVSLLSQFFIYSMVGWAWEVLLHYVTVGNWVNRGLLHGPWLPIYGSGAVLVIAALFRIRRRRPLFILGALILCGTMEYYSSVIIELKYGERWWDYTGYFFNLNGRICAEGLLVFAVGCTAFVYFISPFLDNVIRRISIWILAPVLIILCAVFIGDQIYSSSHPNVGKGVIAQTAEVSGPGDAEEPPVPEPHIRRSASVSGR